jgi:hypothetical protein
MVYKTQEQYSNWEFIAELQQRTTPGAGGGGNAPGGGGRNTPGGGGPAPGGGGNAPAGGGTAPPVPGRTR